MPKWGGRSRPAAGRGWGQPGGVKHGADKCRAINCEEDAGAGKGPGVCGVGACGGSPACTALHVTLLARSPCPCYGCAEVNY